MKNFIKKNLKRFLVGFLIFTYVCMLVPFTDVYATPVNETTVSADDGSTLPFVITNNADDVFMFKTDSTTPWYIVSLSSFNYPYGGSTNYGTASKTWIYDEHGNNTKKFMYSHYYGNFGRVGTKWYYNFDGPYYYIPSSDSQEYERIMYNFLTTGNTDGIDTSHAQTEGSIDDPIYDENIGTLILDKTIMYEESNGNDINDLYNLWSWKNKTSTGFSLSNNDYAQTFIQVKVESKCVIYSDLRHTKVKQSFDNYGEKGMLFNQIPVNNQPLKVSYLTDVPKALPLTHAESHNPLYVGYNYTLYFRVVCTNSTQVIPDDSSSEWHCGGWRAMDCNGDVLNSQSDKSSNGHFDDNDNWIADEDDGNNDVTAGSDSVHDTDDAKDSFANYQPSSGMSTDTAIGNLKDLMNMVGYIPTMIATLFSFLPSWCITLIAVTFASMLVLIVYKLIRG